MDWHFEFIIEVLSETHTHNYEYDFDEDNETVHLEKRQRKSSREVLMMVYLHKRGEGI